MRDLASAEAELKRAEQDMGPRVFFVGVASE